MSDPDGRHAEVFREEARELLADLERSLLELETTPEDSEHIGRAFRALHTIKGSGSMFGFDQVVAFAHELETLFDLVRNGQTPVTRDLIDVTLSSGDLLLRMLDSETGARQDPGPLMERIRALMPAGANSPGPAAKGRKTPDPDGRGERPATYRIRFRPSPNILSTGTDPMLLIDDLRRLGDCRVIVQTEAVPDLKSLDPEACYLYWDVILTTSRGMNAIRDVFIFVEGDSELRIDTIDEHGFGGEADYKRLGEILIERGDLDPRDLEDVLARTKRLGEVLVESGLVGQGKIVSALVEQQYVRGKRKKGAQGEAEAASIRVPSRKLDKLADLIGELVTLQARLSRFSLVNGNPELAAVSEGVEHLTEELRDTIMGVRLVPMEAVFGKLRRIVRDLSSELCKDVELETEGAETELDKSIIERLIDPLVHLIRNSMDHGMEPADLREALGKPRKGVIRLSAVHSGASVLIRIMDDGKGLDAAAIKAKAVERGLIPQGAEVPEKDLYQFIFNSGFSTAKEVTKVSGRGVGMDVVKKNIQSLRGTIGIESLKGQGMSVTIRLPLTLAIIDGLLVKIGGGNFVIPLGAVHECVELARSEAARKNGRRIANVRGEIVPYISLRDFFGTGGVAPEIEQIVITETEGGKVGFLVDQVIGENQTVIKALGGVFKNIDWISGATILGDGSIALIIAAGRIIKWMELEDIGTCLKIDSEAKERGKRGRQVLPNGGEKGKSPGGPEGSPKSSGLFEAREAPR